MPVIGSVACNAVPFYALGDPTKVKEGSERIVVMPNGQKTKAICLNGQWAFYTQGPEYTLATLPSAAGLPTGTPYTVTDYGGNVAVAVNGQWRFELPFRTTWAGRPPVGIVPAGTELQVTDYANQKFISDGTYWRPAQGRAMLKSIFGLSQAAGGQIAQISGATSGLFAVPGGCKIPAGMIIPNSRISVQSDSYKTGANGTANFMVTLGASNSSSDATMVVQAMTITTGVNSVATCAARFSTATDRFNSRNWQGEGVSSGSNNSMSDRIGNVNTNADMWLNVGVSSANTGDIFNLVSLQVTLEA